MSQANPQQPVSYWVALLKKCVLVPEVDEATVAALCCHLADLGVLEKSGEEAWSWAPPLEGSLPIEKQVEKQLKILCASDKGFALSYFLKHPPATPPPGGEYDSKSLSDEDTASNNPRLLGHKTSNLSNLQIVKKYERQVQSFIDMEKNYTKKLLGPHTTLKEARKIFNFILSRMKQKTAPRPWEQLSRRRHK